MEKDKIIDEIKAIISDVTDIPKEEIPVDRAMMEEMELTSLEILTIIAELEKKFKIGIPEKNLREFITINDIASYLQEQN